MPALLDKILAIETIAAVANSMGDVTEGLSYRDIEARYGWVDRLLPQDKSDRERPQPDGTVFHYHAHHRPPGMTEDGQERHRLLTTAIIEQGGRVSVGDLARVWLRDIESRNFGYLLGPQDQVIYQSLADGMPPHEVGRRAAWPGFIGTAKMMAPIGVVNACNPAQAALDALDVGRIKDVLGQPGNYALEAAAALAAGVAEGLKPRSSVERVIETAFAQLSEAPRQEVEEGLQWARSSGDWKALRPLYAARYEGKPISNAVEVLSSALAVLSLTGPDPTEVVLRCVNFGRDCDCRAYVAGTLAAAVAGSAGLPAEWAEVIDAELTTDPYTVSTHPLRESAGGLYRALMGNLARLEEQVSLIEEQK